MIELPDHPFFLASQFHPEFKSRPNRAHPMFRGFIAAGIKYCEEHGISMQCEGNETAVAAGR